MEKILARRFAPFNFSAIPGFPNVVPSPNEWGDYLPIFGKREEDNPAQHLSEFHELMHQWEIHHEDVLLKMFMFSLAGDARKWYHSLPPASISSLSEFHAAFIAYCQEFYPSELICHNCGEGYHNSVQNEAISDIGCEDDPDDLDQKSFLSPPHSSASEECYGSDGNPREEEDTLSELREQVKYLSTQLERLKSEDCAEDLPVSEADVLDGSFEEIIEDFVNALTSSPDELVVSDQNDEEVVVEEDCSLFLHEISQDVFTFGVETEERGIVPFLQVGEALFPPDFDDYLEEEQQNPTSPFADQNGQPFYDSYESCSELETQDFQEEKEPEEQDISCPEPVSEQPPPESNEPTSVVHQPVLIRDIQPHVNNCVAEEAVCRPFSGIRHSFYDPVGEYMEWHVLYALEPPYSISTSPCEEKLKSVAVLLSRLQYLLVIIDRRKELLSRKLLEWLWWKFSFT
jgi:hypothetical protein